MDTPKQPSREDKLKTFLSKAVTRQDSPHKVLTIEKDSQGNVSRIVGIIMIENTRNNKVEEIPMSWNVNGLALSPSRNFDLVVKEKYEG